MTRMPRCPAPHQTPDYVEASYEPDESPTAPVPYDPDNAMHRAIREASRRHFADTVAERNAG